MRKITLALAAAAFSIAAPAEATTIFSEDFSSGFGVFTPTGQVGINTGNDYVPCCGTSGSVANMSNPFASFGSGDQPGGTLTTTFNTQVGAEYTLTFDAGALGATTDGLTFLIDGLGLIAFVGTADNDLDTTFDTFSANFFATGTTTTLSITGGGSPSTDVILDNIGVDAVAVPVDNGVPEPSTWAMMLLGFGAVGVALRRRKRLLQAA